ncbi:MAG: AAA family ATPase [Methanomicrobiales archaeon]|nr:AAA family ATPase [Methanomicrobiales archaeon]
MHHALHNDRALFRDIDVFDPSYLPERLHHRDAQIQDLSFCIYPALRGGTPLNAILRGPPGAGKTATVRSIFAELIEEPQGIIPVYVDCRQDHTHSAVYRRIFEEIFGHAPPQHTDEVLDGIAARLRDTGARLLVCLDDADYLIAAGTYNLLLYQLLRLYEKWNGVRGAGIFAVTSDLGLNLYAEADGAVRSVFHPHEITFWPYAKTEIRDILGDRVQKGLCPGVMPKVRLERIVDIVADEQDIRVGIDLVREAARRAGREGRRKVTRDDVEAVAGEAIAQALAARTAALSPGERALLYRIAEQSLAGGDMIAGSAFEGMQDCVTTEKTIYHARLRRLAGTGIIDLLWTGKGREIILRYSPEEVFSACTGEGCTQ